MEKLTKPSPTSVLRSSDARDYCCRGNSLGSDYGRALWNILNRAARLRACLNEQRGTIRQ